MKELLFRVGIGIIIIGFAVLTIMTIGMIGGWCTGESSFTTNPFLSIISLLTLLVWCWIIGYGISLDLE